MVVELTSEESWLLEFIVTEYKTNAEWPKGWFVERTALREQNTTDSLARLGDLIGRPTQFSSDDHEFRLPLSLVAQSKAGREIIESLPPLIPTMWNIFVSSDEKDPSITAEALRTKGWSANQIRLAFLALRAQHRLTRGSSWDRAGENWSFHIDRDVQQFQDYSDAITLVEAMEEPKRDATHETYQEHGPLAPSPNRSIELGSAFILMAMDPGNPALEDVANTIKEICKQFDIEAVRVDDVEHQDRITDVVLARIRTSEFVLADLSHERPNVYYEVGYAHAVGVRPILFRKASTNVHFDLAGYNVPEYANITELRQLLLRRLESLTNKPARSLSVA